MEKILIYTTDKSKKDKIRAVCSSLGIESKDLNPKDLPLRVGSLAGIFADDQKDNSVPPFYNMPEVMIFCGLTDDRLKEFLAVYKREAIEPVALKAVITGYNIGWSLYQLIEELKREHDSI